MAAETADVAALNGPVLAEAYDGEPAAMIATRLGLPKVVVYRTIGSTMDAAHALGAAGELPGTIVLADEQTTGRGRQGRSWRSGPARGIWLTLLERPSDAAVLEVLSLRVGLAAARALDMHAAAPVRLKWPNDLLVDGGKLAGVLVEARWRGERPDWVAIGIGVNVAAPHDVPGAAGLRDGVRRPEVLASLVPAVRAASARHGPLGSDELSEFATRDQARGRRCASPCAGIVLGVTATGELAVETPDGVRSYRTGSLLLEEGA